MLLVVNVTVSGVIDANNNLKCTAVYEMASSVPPTPKGVVVVAPDGNIDLKKLVQTDGFDNGTDVYFMLHGTVESPTGPVPVFFKTPREKAVKITLPGGQPTNIKARLPGTDNATMLLLDDFDVLGYTYEYCLNIVAFSGNKAAEAALDPGIVDRGP